jgi:hypothetical protein
VKDKGLKEKGQIFEFDNIFLFHVFCQNQRSDPLLSSIIDEMATPLRVEYPGTYYHGINDPDFAV